MLSGIEAVFFYLFAFIAVGAAFMVISARNPVHSVLYLILTFFNAAALFLLTGAEFLAMILLVVYVGAVAVLFLFVVMMLDINFVELRQGFLQYLPIDATMDNTRALGQVLYTRYVFLFQGAAAVLLVAMIGAIVLTLRHKPHVRRQVIADQVARTPATGMEVVQIKSGDGIAE